MIINLKDIQIIEGKIVKQCIPLEMDGFHCRLGAFPVLRKRNINFGRGRLENDPGYSL